MPIAGLMLVLVAVTMGPMIKRPCPIAATGFRPIKSDMAPTKGQSAALGMR